MAVVLSSLVAGCGSSLNLDGDSRIYGGVQTDLQRWHDSVMHVPDPSRPEAEAQTSVLQLAQAVGALADIPFSFIWDTVTLPVTIATAIEERNDEDPAVRQTVVTVEKTPKSKDSGSSSGK
jgi:uncharacterized protein YceK